MSAFDTFFIQFVGTKGKTLHTHSTLLDDQLVDQIRALKTAHKSKQNTLTFLALWGSLEAVNRLEQLVKMPYWKRASIVVGSTLLVNRLIKPVNDYLSVNQQLKTLMEGQPVFENKRDVVELDKAFFFLDDDNNYEPSLLHHGS